MTDVMEESASWEQRREMRRKKRQETLAEADRLISTEAPTSGETVADDDDGCEKERQKRRREREERRRKEREELGKELQEEEKQRGEREKRREERRRRREEHEAITEPIETETSKTIIKGTTEIHDNSNGYEETAEVVLKTTEIIEKEYTIQNGRSNALDNIAVDKDSEDEEVKPKKQDDKKEYKDEEEGEIEKIEKPDEEKVSKSEIALPQNVEDNITGKVVQQSNAINLDRGKDDKRKGNASTAIEEIQESQSKELEERKKMRMQKQREEKESEKEEAAKRETARQEKLRHEREERERRRGEAEAKRQKNREQLSEVKDAEVSHRTRKALTSPLLLKKPDQDLSPATKEKSLRRNILEKTAVSPTDNKLISKMEVSQGRPPAVPRRTQSVKAVSAYMSGTRGLRVTDASEDNPELYQPTRPLSRKKQSRRSLDAMEKQAGELYNFLSDLENKKASSSREDLMSFLSDSAKVDPKVKAAGAEGSANKSLAYTSRSKRISVKDRAKGFLKPVIKEEPNDAHPTPKARSYVSQKSSSANVNNNNKKSPLPRKANTDVVQRHQITLHAEKTVTSNETDVSIVETLELEETVEAKTPRPIARSQRVRQRPRPIIAEKPEHLAKDSPLTEPQQSKSAIEVEKTISASHPTSELCSSDVEKSSRHSLDVDFSVGSDDSELSSEDSESSSEENAVLFSSSSSSSSKKMSRSPMTDSSPPQVSTDRTIEIIVPKKSSASSASPTVSVHSMEDATEETIPPDTATPTSNTVITASTPLEQMSPDSVKEANNVEQLNKHVTESQKSTKRTPIQNVGKLENRLEKYTKQATKQVVKNSPTAPGKATRDVNDRRSKWERGEIQSTEKSVAKKQGAVTASGGVSSRKNLWENGKIGSASSKSTRKADDVKGAGFSTRKDQWLKVTQKHDNSSKKTESPVVMKTGVLSRLNRWEKGEVSGVTASDKAKPKTNVPLAGLLGRKAKWENITSVPPKPSPSQKKPNIRLATDVSNRKNVFEIKTSPPQVKPLEVVNSSKEKTVKVEAKDVNTRTTNQIETKDDEEGITLHSSDDGDDDFSPSDDA